MSNSSSDDGPSWTITGNATCLPWDDPDAIWPYCPSEGAALLFAILFGMTTIASIYFAAKYRKTFCWVIIMASIWECVGYAIRAAATQFQQDLPLYFVQLLLVLLSPLLINAFVYMVFARLVNYFSAEQKAGGIRARRLSLIFVCWDILSFLVQLAGASQLSSDDPTTIQNGKYLYMGGMGLQQLGILVFSVLVFLFWRNVGRAGVIRQTSHRKLTILVFTSLALITVRIIFRLVEYSQGFDSSIVRSESYQYIFDAVPMLFIITCWAIYHPGRVLVGEGSEFPKISRKEKKMMKQEKKAAKKAKKEGRDMTMGMEPIRSPQSYEQLGSANRFDRMEHEERGSYGNAQRGW